MSSNYLNYHFSGDIVLTTQEKIEASYLATETLSNYLISLSLDTGVEKEIENIGKWIGYPRPYVPYELSIENAFLFFNLTSPLAISPEHGMSSLADLLTGGRLISLVEHMNKLPLDIYVSLLKLMALVKYNGWTLWTLDNMLNITGVDYEISWTVDSDVLVTFDPDVNPIYIYIFSFIINKFSTLPRIILTI